ncbi:hypothetical protein LEAN103870_18285 [Legionella anisa]|uniref:Uncharacterized protein n=1 Tax=Legionella anisa TaxID=28082 RepID=A0AAX0WR87_9GAMM|nr:hypothetical protein [Legionella anisa]AWN75004.1 hypothetical protein DLD14_14800 [Legionella anisa]KTC67347.1 hypothetical protein Lani_3692 [Legionella anisa]MBN5933984.1 hypothetical protein [Legionella anisa]MCW8424793.1 hypothetical protein [Legionella anisa]MCW8446088.1 hypothetical protein [Legionella anisa]
MKEQHYAYKITHGTSGMNCPHSTLEKDRMVDLLKEIESQHNEGIFWIFKQFGDQPQEPLCIIDCSKKRIYFHYSGEVEDLKNAIANLSH